MAPPPTPAAIVVLTGDGQTGHAGAPLPEPLRARVTSPSGTGLENIAVTFMAAQSSGTVSPTVSLTNSDGVASTTWTLSTGVGVNSDTIRAAVGGVPDSAIFTATVIPGTPASVTAIGGDGQHGLPGQALSRPVVVEARDQYGNPTPQVAITWTAEGGGSILVANTITGADGRASNIWTLGSDGANIVRATAAGLVGSPVVFTAAIPLAAHIEVVDGDDQSGRVGETLPKPVIVKVTDADNNPVGNVNVAFSFVAGVSAEAIPALVATNAEGRASATVRLGSLVGSVAGRADVLLPGDGTIRASFVATALPGASRDMKLVSGQDQTGTVNSVLASPLVVQVTDAFGNPTQGVRVDWTVTGGGRVSAASRITGTDGKASVTRTLGSTVGRQTTRAVADGLTSSPITFDHTATADVPTGFDIDVRFLVPLTSIQRQAFLDAEARWQDIVTGDVSDNPTFLPAGTCGDTSPELNELVDDLLIFVTVEEIDGPGGTLAAAGPCDIRAGDELPYVGRMLLDVQDLEELESTSTLKDVILHEMGHVLGIGRAIWGIHGLVSGAGSSDPHFTGVRAIAAFDAVGGNAYTLGEKVPVENTGPVGTFGGHWRESVLGSELMTGFINDVNPLSKVTIESLADLGYSVNSAQADSYTLTAALRASARGFSRPLGDDRLIGPIRVVDRTGRVVRVIAR